MGIFEEDVTSIKNFGIWIRYQSRTGFHNAYKEYREISMNKAADALYEEMASRHRVRAPCLQIIKICQVADADVKRDNTIQFLGVKEPVSFPVINKVSPRQQEPEDHLQVQAPELLRRVSCAGMFGGEG